MEPLVKGDVVILPFPFSDLSAAKKRPALVLTAFKNNDLILAMITSKEKNDGYSISLEDGDFLEGSLDMPSNIRPNRLFTAHKSIISYTRGKINQGKMNEVVDKLIEMIRR